MKDRSRLEIASWIASILALLFTGWTYFADQDKKSAAEATDLPPGNLVADLTPPGKGLRHAEKYLGIPIEESETRRVYEKYGYRFTLTGIQKDKSFDSIEIGPSIKSNTRPPLDLSGPWGKIPSSFGTVTIGQIDKAASCLKVSDFNSGANGACKNVFEVECGGAQYQDRLFIRAGVLGECHYAMMGTEPPDSSEIVASYRNMHRLKVGAPMPALDQLIQDATDLPLIADAKINFFAISPRERKEPRGAGGDE